ncbi:MAG: hypothetical protein A2X61_11910 [Ignavibacteria bacterium GWB2_35_12]|nr:MAG: hypothetical protein A2X61_11910 [Ignavibacteria bacterium GWB2_35_12]OGU96066.1 MAG: hypothetical protein A2220_14785 [Ignavibacteria bacterium RIFOXYA2_FULL_35_10]OGV24439.1 MAG: hypothetical protein A2475_12690 [Ignavibacteria bacterium RIFOXYC2_FULL_35_21]
MIRFFLIMIFCSSYLFAQQEASIHIMQQGGKDTTFSIFDINKITFTPCTPSAIFDNGNQTVLPQKITFTKSYPNPFNENITIEYDLEKSGNVSISIFDSQGNIITDLSNSFREKGNHSFLWNGKNNHGNSVLSGIYFYQIKFDNEILIKNIIHIK